tara:strand:- start:436 stop:543 length:108 start_codon:yes stop_codon:yes gene_type:complete
MNNLILKTIIAAMMFVIPAKALLFIIALISYVIFY